MNHVQGRTRYWSILLGGFLGFTVWPLGIASEHLAGHEILMWHVDAMSSNHVSPLHNLGRAYQRLKQLDKVLGFLYVPTRNVNGVPATNSQSCSCLCSLTTMCFLLPDMTLGTDFSHVDSSLIRTTSDWSLANASTNIRPYCDRSDIRR